MTTKSRRKRQSSVTVEAGGLPVLVVPAATAPTLDAREASSGPRAGAGREVTSGGDGALSAAGDAPQAAIGKERKRAAALVRRRTTPAMVEANRANSLKCTGPVTDVGKMNARLNAVKHGLTALVGSLAQPQLGEDVGDLQEIRRNLRTCFRPRDRFELLLLDEMVENRWRRRRTVRAESSLLATQHLQFELEYGRRLAGEGRSPEATGQARAAAASGLAALPDSSAKFNLILQCLRAAQEAVAQEGFGEEGLRRLETVYGQDPGLAGAILLASYRQRRETATGRVDDAAGDTSRASTGSSAPSASSRQSFLDALAAEIACFEKLQELHETTAVSLAAASAGAQNALSQTDAQRFTRYEAFLDRQFDRLVKQFNDWREAHSDATSFVDGTDAEEEDVEAMVQNIRAKAAARDKALTEAIKAAWGEDFVSGPPR
ncbi:MAG TPA: hypothetical protein VMT20_20100 [Terriglobia bacterium]|nr:hypothetical protein [Terriglobia bacterium]